MLRFYLIIIFYLFHFYFLEAQSIVINEIQTSNENTILDSDGESSDWIELYNNSNNNINLLGYSLSDEETIFDKWIFPSIEIPSNGFLLVFASGKDEINNEEIHTNFKLSQSGEPLILSHPTDGVISSLELPFITTDFSYGNITDGNNEKTIFNNPTPNFTNASGNGVFSSHETGFYNSEFDLELIPSNSNVQIYYTINGNVPTLDDILYTDAIPIKHFSDLIPSYSNIPTTPLEGPEQLQDIIWKEPQEFYQANVIRFASFENGIMQSKIYTQTFFVDDNIIGKYEFPIISLVTDSINLFGHENGIYIPGKRFEENGFNWWPEGNYWNKGSEWEREMHITYFEQNGGIAFESDAGMRIRGKGSATLAQKSLGLYFRNDYGRSNIDYPVFDSLNVGEYKRLILRSSGNDFLETHLRDALLQSILNNTGLETQNFKPAVLFINGEYWGIHNIREKYDQHYFAEHYDIDKDDVNILGFCGEIEEGDNSDYLSILDYVSNNDLQEDIHYDFIKSKIDILNFIDFQIAEIYFANYDWPCNNYKIWKGNETEDKWRFLIYDLDLSFNFDDNSNVYTQSFEHAASEEDAWPFCDCSNILFRKLMDNPSFKNKFIERFEYHLNTTFDKEIIINKIDHFEELFSNEMEKHIKRWNYPESIEEWQYNLDKMRNFANDRPCIISNYLMAYFDLESLDFNCNIDNEFPEDTPVILFPNPGNEYTFLYNNSEHEIIDAEILIYDALGRLVEQKNNVNLEIEGRETLDLSHFPEGTFVLFFKSQSVNESFKLIISHPN